MFAICTDDFRIAVGGQGGTAHKVNYSLFESDRSFLYLLAVADVYGNTCDEDRQ